MKSSDNNCPLFLIFSFLLFFHFILSMPQGSVFVWKIFEYIHWIWIFCIFIFIFFSHWVRKWIYSFLKNIRIFCEKYRYSFLSSSQNIHSKNILFLLCQEYLNIFWILLCPPGHTRASPGVFHTTSSMVTIAVELVQNIWGDITSLEHVCLGVIYSPPHPTPEQIQHNPQPQPLITATNPAPPLTIQPICSLSSNPLASSAKEGGKIS